MRLAIALLSILILLTTNAFLASAQSSSSAEERAQPLDPFIREYNEKRAKNPDGLEFTVRLKDNRKQFHLGEIVTLELSFASSKPDTFTLDSATYDRSGRLHSDGFVLDQRDTAPDPLKEYFYSGLHAFMMGGLRGFPDLFDKPYLITAELNEWRRIDKPGHYRMYVVSGRVGTKKTGPHLLLNADARSVVSNVIEFDILPADEKWSRQKLNDAIAALSKPTSDRYAACRTLRFLGTPAAVTELIKRFRGDDKCEWQYKFGLIGSPHRGLVIREMENAISLREQAITSHFINTLALLEFMGRVGPEAPQVDGDLEQRTEYWLRRKGLFNELCLHYVRQLVVAIPQKQGRARAMSLQTLLDYRSDLKSSEFRQWSTLLASMSEVFNRLPLDDQLSVLQRKWKPIASPAMLPVLREVVNYSFTKKSKSDFDGVIDEYTREELRSIAARRIYELSPEEGRRLILEEIRLPKPRLNQDALRSLPDETLPEIDTVIITKLEESNRGRSESIAGSSELIERYATDAILPRVRSVYESRDVDKWECRTQGALLAYFLRVAPEIGSEYFDKALAARTGGYPRCYEEHLKNVAALHMSEEVEEAATAALDDENSEVVANAASVLAEHGSMDAEKALWQRFEKWHKAMLNRRTAGTRQELSATDVKIEDALREALIRGRAWALDPAKLKRLRELCLTDMRCTEVDQMIQGWDYHIYIQLDNDDDLVSIGVAQYQLESLAELRKKLLQFPKGTVFKWMPASTVNGGAKSEQLRQQIKNYLEENGMSLKPAPETDNARPE